MSTQKTHFTLTRGSYGRTSSLAFAGIATAAVFIGHQLTYRLAASTLPHGHSPVEDIHGYLGLIAPWVLSAALMGIGLVFTFGLVKRRSTGQKSVALFTRLFFFQACLFVLAEVGERVASSSSLIPLFRSPLLPMGVGVQALLAVVGAFLIITLTKAGVTAAESLASSVPLQVRQRATELLGQNHSMRAWHPATGFRLRAPPSLCS